MNSALLADIWEIAWGCHHDFQHLNRKSRNPEAAIRILHAWHDLRTALSNEQAIIFITDPKTRER
jgi:hypothetical protein